MENLVVTMFLLIGWASAHVANSAVVRQKFAQPQEQASPVATPTAEVPRQQPEIPADAVFYQSISWSPDDSRIAFAALQAGKWNIFTMRADGSQLTRLTSNPEINYFNPTWSPNGKQVVFSARLPKPAKSDIYVMNVDGSKLRQLTTDAATDSSPVFSPDGKRIAFISDRDGKDHEMQIYVMRADGTQQRRLVKSTTRDYEPQWSPDGKRIVYYAEKGDSRDQVWVVNADGSQPTLVTNGVGHNIFPAWTPAGLIVFASQRTGPEENMSMYTVRPDGSDLKQLSTRQAFLARFAHSGARVAFLAGAFPKNAMYVANLDGSNLQKLTP